MSNSVHLVFNRYKLVESGPLYEIFLGKNEKNQDSLLFRVNSSFPEDLFAELTNTTTMAVDLIQMENNQTILCFDLLDTDYQTLFFSFADNMISFVSSQSNEDSPFEAIVLRYSQWQRLLKTNRTGLLSVETIRGMIGELLFLRDFLIPEFGAKTALGYWKGPIGADQDFRTEKKWYEIKTITSGSDTVLISSIEQLDSEQFGPGEIVIFALDATVPADPEKITVKSLVDEIKVQLSRQESYTFDNFLFSNLGYYDKPEYETGNYVVRLSSTQRYAIDAISPVMRRSSVPSAVVFLKYNLSLAGLDACRID